MVICGVCLEMCPRSEILMRERERLLDPLEIMKNTEKNKYPKADFNRVVKMYTRSAAGVDLTNPELLRPADVLYKTVKYLLTEVLEDSRFNFVHKYNFISDRCRSISQDIVVQQVEPKLCIQIYEPIVKYHIFCGYMLNGEDIHRFDPTLNKKYLMEYFMHLLVCYDALEMMKEGYNINNLMDNFKLADSCSTNRAFMEMLYMLINIDSDEPLLRFLKIPATYKSPLSRLGFEISLLYKKRNYVRLCKAILQLPVIGFCAVSTYLPVIRRKTFEIMSVAYNSKILQYPIITLKELLLYDSETEAEEDCLYYGLKISSKNIYFQKENYNNQVSTKCFKQIGALESRLKEISISGVLLNGECS